MSETVKTAEIAEFLNVTTGRVSQMISEGKLVKAKRGYVTSGSWLAYLKANDLLGKAMQRPPEPAPPTEPKEEKADWKEEARRLNFLQEAGVLIPVTLAQQTIADHLIPLRQELLALGPREAAALAAMGTDQAGISRHLTAKIETLLNTYVSALEPAIGTGAELARPEPLSSQPQRAVAHDQSQP